MTGQEITNVTLTANTETLITYADRQQAADVVNYGPDAVFICWNGGSATVGGQNCLRLDSGQTYEIRTRYHWSGLHMISAGNPSVQVVSGVNAST